MHIFLFVVHSEARTRLDNLTKNPVFKYMDFFMKCANVAFSVVPGIGYGDAENGNNV